MKKITLVISLLVSFLNFIAEASPRVSLLTCSPGEEIYELEGHTALRIVTDDGQDVVVNWGLFDFNAPGFVYRFVKGETDYMAGAAPTAWFLYQYEKDGREVTEQVLPMDSLQVATLIDLVTENLRPENRVYRYNYIKDNCSTRPLEMVERVIGHPLPHKEVDFKPTTWRREMTRYHKDYPWYQFGIDLALGSGLDETIDARQATFAPVALRDYLDLPAQSLTVPSSVVSEPTPLLLTPIAVSFYILVIVILTALSGKKYLKLFKWVTTVYYLAAGLAGLLLTFLIFVSVHEATSPNWLYLWLNPLCFIPVIAVWIKRLKTLYFYYQIINFVALITLCCVGIAGVQELNTAFYPLIMADIVLSIAWIRIANKRCHQYTE